MKRLTRPGAPARRLLILMTLAPALALPAVAQNLTLEEVVVTAQKRVESLQDVPISLSAMSGERMAEANIINLEA